MTAIDVKTVAVIGAGVSGVAAAHHLRAATLDVTVFERGRKAGGIWYVIVHAAFPGINFVGYLTSVPQ